MNTHRLREADFREEIAPTTRRFPRSLSDAFPDERAAAVERPAPRGETILWWIMVLGCGAAGLVLTAWG